MDDSWAGYFAARAAANLNTPGTQILCIAGAAAFAFLGFHCKKSLRTDPVQYTGRIVHGNKLGQWPQVRLNDADKDGSGIEYEIHAPHWTPGTSPRDNDGLFFLFLIGFVVLVLVLWSFSMLAALIAAAACIPVMKGWPENQPHHGRILMTASYIWFPPVGQGQYERVPLDAFKMHVQVPHRLAQAEMREHEQIVRKQALDRENALRRVADAQRKHDEGVATGKIKKDDISTPRPSSFVASPSPPEPKYQIASELIMITGVGDHIWQAIAEFGNDEHGHQANRLYHAINFVKNECLREAQARAARNGMTSQGAPQPGNPPDVPSGPVEAFE